MTTIIKDIENEKLDLEPKVVIIKNTWRQNLWNKLMKPTKKIRKKIPSFNI